MKTLDKTKRRTASLISSTNSKHQIHGRINWRLTQLRTLSRLGLGLWILGTTIGALGGSILIEATMTVMGLAALLMGIVRSS